MFDRARAIQVIQGAGSRTDAEIAAALSPFAPFVLAEIAGSTEPWSVRRAAIRALAGRVDDAAAKALLDRALDSREVGELRCDALDVLASAERTEIVSSLRRLRAEIEAMEQPPYGVEDAVVSASARLGDIEAAVPALRLRYDAWRHRRRRGEEAVGALEEQVGVEALARAFGAVDASIGALGGLAAVHPEPVVRRWAIDVAPADAPWLTAALGDMEWVVAEGAHAALLRSSPAVVPPLRALAADPTAAPVVRARAILVLLRRGLLEDARSLWEALEGRHIEIPGLPSSVRRAVLYHYLAGERGTDPRWLLEGALDLGFDLEMEREDGPDEPPERILEAARHALEQAGCRAGDAIPIGAVHQQGGGTYVHLQVGDGVLEVSELGRFVHSERPLPPGARESLERAGFLFVEGALAAQVFEGLGVYFFGRRDPLSVYNLLFYWQD